MNELKPFQCDLNLLNDRILNLGCGLATLPDNGTMQVSKAFLAATLDYMEELHGMRRARPATGPLTLDELRRMDGEPVWVKEITPEPIDGNYWGLVDPDLVCVGGYGVGAILSTATDGKSRSAQTPFSDYGKTWLAYRTKPKEGD